MADRIMVERLVSTGEYEHLTIRVERDIIAHDNEGTRVEVNVLEQLVRKWAALAKKRDRLERELAYAQEMASWYGDTDEDATKARNERIAELTKQLADLEGEWD